MHFYSVYQYEYYCKDKHTSTELQPWLIVRIVSALQALESLLRLDKETNHLKVKEISL